MTQDEIIRMAREAGLAEWHESIGQHGFKFADTNNLERFAALVAAHERECIAAHFDNMPSREMFGGTIADEIRVDITDSEHFVKQLDNLTDEDIKNIHTTLTHELWARNANTTNIEAAVLAEREACAKVCDERVFVSRDVLAKSTAGLCAAAIRAKGEK